MDEFTKRDDIVVAEILSPTYPTDFAFMKAICGEFGFGLEQSLLKQERELREFLVNLDGEDKTAVLFINEAQYLKGVQLELRTKINGLDEKDAAKPYNDRRIDLLYKINTRIINLFLECNKFFNRSLKV